MLILLQFSKNGFVNYCFFYFFSNTSPRCIFIKIFHSGVHGLALFVKNVLLVFKNYI